MSNTENRPSLLSIRVTTVAALVGCFGGAALDGLVLQSRAGESITEALRAPTKEKVLTALVLAGTDLGTKAITGGCIWELVKAAGRTIKDRTNW